LTCFNLLTKQSPYGGALAAPSWGEKMQKSYRFLSGPDDAAFCQRVSDALADGYVLYGNPVMVVDNGTRVVGQAVVLPTVRVNAPSASERQDK
jgi:hypothetical protein